MHIRPPFPRNAPAPAAVVVVAALATLGCSGGSYSRSMTGGTEIRVDAAGGGDYASLQSAVDAAPSGATIRIAPGTYDGAVTLRRAVTLVGAGAATVVRSAGAPTALPDDGGLDDGLGTLAIRNASGVIVENLTVSAPQDGILVRDSRDVVLRGVTVLGAGDDGVDVRNSDGVSVSGTFEGSGDHGIVVREGSRNVRIAASRIASNADNGVRVRDSSAVQVEDCEVAANADDGVLVRDASAVAVRRNRIAGNGGYGIRVRNAPDTAIENNEITGNVEGDVRLE